ncbi:ATP-binding protein, partial [Anaerorhabdus sp.]
MMQDCAMQILEIVMNSNHANSKFIEVHIVDSIKNNMLEFTIIDDGKGMDEETCRKVTDPFVTSRSSRKIGMGLPF